MNFRFSEFPRPLSLFRIVSLRLPARKLALICSGVVCLIASVLANVAVVGQTTPVDTANTADAAAEGSTAAAADEPEAADKSTSDGPITPEVPELGRPVEYERDIHPILEANCIACHNAAVSENDLILENAAAILKGGSAGPAIVPGKPDESLLYQVAARSAEPVMPPLPNSVQAVRLTPQQVGLLRQWISEGAVGGAGGKSLVMKWQPISDQLKAVYSVDVDLHGRFVAAGRGGSAKVYDLIARENVASLVDPSLSAPDTPGAPAVAHRDFVHAVAFHPSGDLLATAGYREIKIWQRMIIGPPVAQSALPPETVCWAVSEDHRFLVTAGKTPGMAVMNRAAEASVASLETDGQAVTALQIVAGERPLVIAALADGRLQTNVLTTGELLQRSAPLESQTMTLLTGLAGNRLAALSTDGLVRLLAVAPDTGVITVSGQIRSEAGAIVRVAADDATVLTIAADVKAELWKADDASRIAGFDLPAKIRDARISTVVDRIALIQEDGQALLWSLKEPKQLALLNQDLSAVRGFRAAENLKAIRDGRAAVVKALLEEADKEVTAQKEAETKARGELDKAVAAVTEAKTKYDEAIAAAAAARKTLEAAPEDAAAKTASEAADKAETAGKDAHTNAVSQQQLAQKNLDFSIAAVMRSEQRAGDRRQQYAASQQEADAAAAAIEPAKTELAGRQVLSQFAGFAGNGTLVVTGDTTGVIRLWRSADGQPADVLPAVPDAGEILSLNCRGTAMTCATSTSRLMTRNLFPAWQLQKTVGPTDDGSDSIFVDRVLSLAFSPDGRFLAAGGGEASRQGQLTMWNVADWTLVRQFPDAHSDTVYGLEFSADGKLLASASADKFAKVWDVETGKHVQSFEGHTHHVMDVTWKADRTLLASAGADNAIKVWNAETGEQARTISTYGKQVTSLSFVGLQDNLLSSSGDRRVFLHAASNGNPVREFPGSPDYVYRAAATPDGTIVAAGCEDGNLRIWNGADAAVVATFGP